MLIVPFSKKKCGPEAEAEAEAMEKSNASESEDTNVI